MNYRRFGKTVIILFVLLAIIAYFVPLPFYISKPGMARELAPYVKVEDGMEGKGSFMLTTIQMGKANIFTYSLAQWIDYWGIYKEEEIRQENESDEEYEMRQLYLMEGSKEKAIISAFETAGKPYEVTYAGIYIYRVVEGKPADGILKTGDRITAVDGKELESSAQFTDYVTSKHIGDTIQVHFKRGKDNMTEEIQIEKIKETGKPGIGIVLTDDIDVDSNPDVEIDSESIGGPSAGLMFSLEIYNQLVKEDLTDGKDIAGTGTIDEAGKVGPIGGIDQKVVAADKSGAAVFFAPNENGAEDSNYKVAVETAEDIGTDMIIVPVDTMQDAVEFLEKMK